MFLFMLNYTGKVRKNKFSLSSCALINWSDMSRDIDFFFLVRICFSSFLDCGESAKWRIAMCRVDWIFWHKLKICNNWTMNELWSCFCFLYVTRSLLAIGKEITITIFRIKFKNDFLLFSFYFLISILITFFVFLHFKIYIHLHRWKIEKKKNKMVKLFPVHFDYIQTTVIFMLTFDIV